jgi:hypothetical protein
MPGVVTIASVSAVLRRRVPAAALSYTPEGNQALVEEALPADNKCQTASLACDLLVVPLP